MSQSDFNFLTDVSPNNKIGIVGNDGLQLGTHKQFISTLQNQQLINLHDIIQKATNFEKDWYKSSKDWTAIVSQSGFQIELIKYANDSVPAQTTCVTADNRCAIPLPSAQRLAATDPDTAAYITNINNMFNDLNTGYLRNMIVFNIVQWKIFLCFRTLAFLDSLHDFYQDKTIATRGERWTATYTVYKDSLIQYKQLFFKCGNEGPFAEIDNKDQMLFRPPLISPLLYSPRAVGSKRKRIGGGVTSYLKTIEPGHERTVQNIILGLNDIFYYNDDKNNLQAKSFWSIFYREGQTNPNNIENLKNNPENIYNIARQIINSMNIYEVNVKNNAANMALNNNNTISDYRCSHEMFYILSFLCDKHASLSRSSQNINTKEFTSCPLNHSKKVSGTVFNLFEQLMAISKWGIYGGPIPDSSDEGDAGDSGSATPLPRVGSSAAQGSPGASQGSPGASQGSPGASQESAGASQPSQTPSAQGCSRIARTITDDPNKQAIAKKNLETLFKRNKGIVIWRPDEAMGDSDDYAQCIGDGDNAFSIEDVSKIFNCLLFYYHMIAKNQNIARQLERLYALWSKIYNNKRHQSQAPAAPELIIDFNDIKRKIDAGLDVKECYITLLENLDNNWTKDYSNDMYNFFQKFNLAIDATGSKLILASVINLICDIKNTDEKTVSLTLYKTIATSYDQAGRSAIEILIRQWLNQYRDIPESAHFNVENTVDTYEEIGITYNLGLQFYNFQYVSSPISAAAAAGPIAMETDGPDWIPLIIFSYEYSEPAPDETGDVPITLWDIITYSIEGLHRRESYLIETEFNDSITLLHSLCGNMKKALINPARANSKTYFRENAVFTQQAAVKRENLCEFGTKFIMNKFDIFLRWVISDLKPIPAYASAVIEQIKIFLNKIKTFFYKQFIDEGKDEAAGAPAATAWATAERSVSVARTATGLPSISMPDSFDAIADDTIDAKLQHIQKNICSSINKDSITIQKKKVLSRCGIVYILIILNYLYNSLNTEEKKNFKTLCEGNIVKTQSKDIVPTQDRNKNLVEKEKMISRLNIRQFFHLVPNINYTRNGTKSSKKEIEISYENEISDNNKVFLLAFKFMGDFGQSVLYWNQIKNQTMSFNFFLSFDRIAAYMSSLFLPDTILQKPGGGPNPHSTAEEYELGLVIYGEHMTKNNEKVQLIDIWTYALVKEKISVSYYYKKPIHDMTSLLIDSQAEEEADFWGETDRAPQGSGAWTATVDNAFGKKGKLVRYKRPVKRVVRKSVKRVVRRPLKFKLPSLRVKNLAKKLKILLTYKLKGKRRLKSDAQLRHQINVKFRSLKRRAVSVGIRVTRMFRGRRIPLTLTTLLKEIYKYKTLVMKARRRRYTVNLQEEKW